MFILIPGKNKIQIQYYLCRKYDLFEVGNNRNNKKNRSYNHIESYEQQKMADNNVKLFKEP